MRKSLWVSMLILAVVLILPSACARPAPAAFEVVSLNVTPTEVTAGDTVNVTVEVKNTGGSESVYTATLTVNGAKAETKDVTVAPGATEAVTFSLVKDKAGTYQLTICGSISSLRVKEQAVTSVALEQSKVLYPELYLELLKLPDLKEIDDRDNEAIEDIIRLALDPKNKQPFESMLNEGIRDKRKYCAPLEALLWIAYDREFDDDNSLQDYSLESLMNDAWKETTTSRNYGSERWRDFDDVADRLSSPKLLATYCIDNFRVASIEWEEVMASSHPEDVWDPERTFSLRKGVCMDQSAFALHCLIRHGYSYDDFEVHKNHAACILSASARSLGRGEHFTCLYIQDGEFYIINVGIPYVRGIKGPFKTVEQAAHATLPNWTEYSFFDADGMPTKQVVETR